MRPTAEEHRQNQRSAYFGNKELKISFSPTEGVSEVVSCRVLDIHEEGCGVDLKVRVPDGAAVLVSGDLGEMLGRPAEKEVQVRGHVVLCTQRSRGFRAGIVFDEDIDWTGTRHSSQAQRPNKELLDESNPDFYEVLQLSPKADLDTVHRVFRIMAQRYHPDNQSSGDSEFFKLVMEAYRVLSDPERRAAYDARHQADRQLRWRIFDSGKAAQGVTTEKAKRKAALSALYTKRMNLPDQPGLTVIELEDLLGIPREQLEFTLWYLREHGYTARADNGRYTITFHGVDQAEQPGEGLVRLDRMLPAASNTPAA
ncbi:MAG: DnaJ domain-containing protein [Acidobacteriia bacterium]|nr:DnaJ domain-containing protein [Terriglobia bacterium]